MSQRILIIFASEWRIGGFITYLHHTAEAFRRRGYEVDILHPAMRDEKKSRLRGRIRYFNLTADTICDLVKSAKRGNTLVLLASIWQHYKKENHFQHLARRLFALGVPAVVQAPWDVSNWLREAEPPLVLAIGTNIQATCRARGLVTTIVPQVYCVGPQVAHVEPHFAALSTARIHAKKNIALICEANAGLHIAHRCWLYGQLDDRFYQMRLNKEYPKWREVHVNGFQEYQAVGLCRNARMVLNLSNYGDEDGDRTEFCSFEAWEADRVLVLHRGWLKGGEISEGVNCVGVDSADELRDLFVNGYHGPSLTAGATAMLKRHSPATVIPIFEQALTRT